MDVVVTNSRLVLLNVSGKLAGGSGSFPCASPAMAVDGFVGMGVVHAAGVYSHMYR